MRIDYIYAASQAIEEKLVERHHVDLPEIADALSNDPFVRAVGRDQYGEMRYAALGQTQEGRYLSVVFIWEQPDTARIITARTMTEKERRALRRQRRSR